MNHGSLAGLQPGVAHVGTVSLFEDLTFVQRMKRMLDGFAEPTDSGGYKLARLELQRLTAPLLALLVPLLLVALLLVQAGTRRTTDRAYPVAFPEPPVTQEPLVKPPEAPRLPSLTPPAPTLGLADGKPYHIPNTPNDPPVPQQPAPDSVWRTRSPIVLWTPNRGPQGVTGVGSGPADTGFTPQGESAVERALRWLKVGQQADGSWPKNKDAMTALAVLSFLAHGERPGESAEFGDTVRAGIQYLMESQRPDGMWSGNYEHPIATYALCEAYGMTQNPTVREAAQKGVVAILRGQHASGGWDYGMKQGDRDDTSVMGWVAQALKAAQVSRVLDDPRELDAACKRLVRGFLGNANPNGGFGYTGPGAGGLSAVGALCLQLHGAANHGQVQKTHALMDDWVLSWDHPKVPGGSPHYYFYYATQAKFLSGTNPARWKTWNAAMLSEYVKAQKIIPKEDSGYKDADGTPRGIGWWENADRHSDRPVMDTCLAALQLMVYYRYLPTLRAPDVNEQRLLSDADDIAIRIQL